MNNIRTHDVIGKSLEMLCRLDHRGGVGADGMTGDGAGIMTEIPFEFFEHFSDLEHQMKASMLLVCFSQRE